MKALRKAQNTLTSKRRQFLEADQQSYWKELRQGDSTTHCFDSARRTAVGPDQMRRRTPEAKAKASMERLPSAPCSRG